MDGTAVEKRLFPVYLQVLRKKELAKKNLGNIQKAENLKLKQRLTLLTIIILLMKLK